MRTIVGLRFLRTARELGDQPPAYLTAADAGRGASSSAERDGGSNGAGDCRPGRRRARLLVAATIAVLLVGCGGETPTEPLGESPARAAGRVELDVRMGDLYYEPDTVEVPAGATLVLNAVNEGAMEHDLELDNGQGTGKVPPGGTGRAELGPLHEPVVAYCTVPGHREAGMEFVIQLSD